MHYRWPRWNVDIDTQSAFNILVVWFVRAIIVITQLDRAGITTIYNKPLDSINQPVQLNATRILNTLLYYELLSLTETEKIYTLVGNEGSLMPIATMYSFYPSIRLVAFPAHQVSGRCKPELFKTCNWHPVVYHCELSSARPFFRMFPGMGRLGQVPFGRGMCSMLLPCNLVDWSPSTGVFVISKNVWTVCTFMTFFSSCLCVTLAI